MRFTLSATYLLHLGLAFSLQAQSTGNGQPVVSSALAELTGTVRLDTTAAVNLRGTQVRIPSLGLSTETSETGAYHFANVPVGRHDVTARRIGFQEATSPVVLTAGQIVHLNFDLKRLVVLDTVAVTATPSERFMREFDDNRRVGLGKFWTREDLFKVEGQTMVSILSQVSGIVLDYKRNGEIFVASSRGPNSIRIGSAPCYAHVYLDNSLLYEGRSGQPPFDIRTIAPENIEAMEYYASPARTPLKYSKLNATCGVLVIWTKRKR